MSIDISIFGNFKSTFSTKKNLYFIKWNLHNDPKKPEVDNTSENEHNNKSIHESFDRVYSLYIFRVAFNI